MERFPTDDGINVAAYDFGGDGPALLLAHATGFHAHVWVPVVDRLRDRFHCYALDSRGHGDSDPAPGGNYDWRGMAADALAAVRGFDLKRPYGAGHSSGGALLLLAEEAEPGTFAGLALYEPIAAATDQPGPPVSGGRLADGARRRRAEFPSFDAAIANYSSKPPFSVFAPEAMRAYVHHGFVELPDGGVRLKCEPEAEARTFEMAMTHDAFLQLPRVKCPVTFMASEFKSPMPLPVLQKFADRLGPLGSTVLLDGLDHFGLMADPARVAATITASLIGPN